MNDCSLITAITGMACAIINCCSDDDVSILSAAFSQLGDTLATYLTQKEICENRANRGSAVKGAAGSIDDKPGAADNYVNSNNNQNSQSDVTTNNKNLLQ